MQATIRIKGYDGVEQVALGKRTVVFSARSRKHKATVTIRVLLPHLAGDARFMARYKRDLPVAARIRHENLVNILDAGHSGSTHFMVTERWEGTPLRELLAEHPRMPAPVALAIVSQIACALEATHAGGLIHRDVRPANVVITDAGAVKLTDLCLATDLGESGRVTHAGKVTATPAYMSPEQTRGEELGPQSDLFSLGALAYELLAGQRAFGGGDFGDIVDRIQAGPPVPLSDRNPVIESAIVRVVERMLCTEPGQRYEHVSEMVMDLEEAMDKYGYHCDDGAVAAYLADPAGAMDAYAETMLERITAKAPPSESAGTASLVRYYERVVFLDPNDDGARKELRRLRREQGARSASTPRRATPRPEAIDDSPAVRFANLDPSAEYRVILESFDRSRDNEASFALKLSMKLRTPLPRVKSFLRKLPARVTDRQSYRQAVHLVKAIEEVGGRVRLDVCPGTGSGNETTARPVASTSGRPCPACGHVETGDEEFCSMCMQRLGPEKLDARVLRERGVVEDNPLADEESAPSAVEELMTRVRNLPVPTPIKVIAGIAMAMFVIQMIVTLVR